MGHGLNLDFRLINIHVETSLNEINLENRTSSRFIPQCPYLLVDFFRLAGFSVDEELFLGLPLPLPEPGITQHKKREKRGLLRRSKDKDYVYFEFIFANTNTKS